eukprot:3452121-Prymnesium_polylepis.1
MSHQNQQKGLLSGHMHRGPAGGVWGVGGDGGGDKGGGSGGEDVGTDILDGWPGTGTWVRLANDIRGIAVPEDAASTTLPAVCTPLANPR